MEKEKSIPEVFIALFKEIPQDKIMWRLTDGRTFTARDMVREFENFTPLGKEYMSDVLRVSRDLISRQANK